MTAHDRTTPNDEGLFRWPVGQEDEVLRAMLRAADPAAPGIAPGVDPSALEDVMTQISTTTQAPPRRRWWPAAAAAALLVGGVGVGIATNGPKPTAPLTLSVAATDASAMCLAIDVATTKQAEVAFDGTVTDVTDGVATLSVTTWYAGGNGATTVRLQAPTGTETALLGTVNPEMGKRYLVVASGGSVAPCSASGEWSQQLQDHFEAAFGR
ncbi:MAG: hypothetical protein IPO89_01440 [Actinomycetales bacterium]|nr:hypothetical protein [Candidatus Lutibacillus vidarii]